MGLLETVLENKSSNKFKAKDSSETFEDFLLKKKELLADDLFPAKVLSLVLKHLNFKKGIILVLNSKNNMWIPLVHEGIDVTSARRIRFGQNLLISSLAGNFSRIDSIEKLENFKNFFSIREATMLSMIDIYKSDRIMLMIPFSGEKLPPEPSFKVITIVGNVLEEIYDLTEKNKSNNVDNISVTLFISKFISKHAENKIFIFKVVLKELVRLIRESSGETTGISTLEQSIVDIIHSMIKDTGQLLQVDSETLLLLYNGVSIHNPKLLAAQINNTLQNYFALNIETYQIVKNYVIYPDDGSNPDELLLKLNT